MNQSKQLTTGMLLLQWMMAADNGLTQAARDNIRAVYDNHSRLMRLEVYMRDLFGDDYEWDAPAMVTRGGEIP